MWYGVRGHRVEEAMVAARRIIALTIDPDQRRALVDISRSRTEATSRVERSRIILAYLDEPSAYAVARRNGVSQQTVTRCLDEPRNWGCWRRSTTVHGRDAKR